MTDQRRGRPEKYPWDKWTDGKPHILVQGKDFDAELPSMQIMVHRKARDLGRNIGARTRINKAGKSIRIQFYDRED